VAGVNSTKTSNIANALGQVKTLPIAKELKLQSELKGLNAHLNQQFKGFPVYNMIT